MPPAGNSVSVTAHGIGVQIYLSVANPANPGTARNASTAVPFGTGPAHNKLFVSFLNMMGVNENTFGMTGAATGEQATFMGPLPGL